MAGSVSFYLIHGAMLWAVWTFFGLFQVATNRYLKHRWQQNMWLHRISGAIVLFTTLLYGIVGYAKLMFVKDDVHAPMGITVTCVILFLVISGVATRSRLVRATENQNFVMKVKLCHKVFAYLMLVTSQVTIFFGIYSYTHNRDIETVLHYVSITLFFVLFAILEAWHQVYLRQDPVKFSEPLNTISEEEFMMEVQKDKQKLLILDDLVLDVTLFADSHPGGKFLIDRNVGKDISKYFYGGYSLEPLQGSKNHVHSNYAREIVNSLIVARLSHKRDTCTVSIKPKIGDDEDRKRPIKKYGTINFVVRGQSHELPGRIRNFYPDLEMLGRHYLVQEQDSESGKAIGNARQYTIATTMEPLLYPLLVQGLQDPSNMEIKAKISDQIEQNRASQELSLTLKNYRVGGLSQTIFEKRDARFSISGPLGLALNVDTNSLNVAFAAGTGILPFMDLVGFISRQTLGVDNVDSVSLGSGFHFWFSVRMNTQEPIGDELLSALAERNSAAFNYDVVRKAPNSGVHWTAEEIEEKLEEISRETGNKVPANIWVCGSPSMNQTFDKVLKDLQRRGKISNVTNVLVL